MPSPIRTVRSYMTLCPYTIGAGETMARAHSVMRARGIRHLPVVRAGALVGLVSQRDLSLMETLKDVDPEEVTVEEAMSPSPFTVSPDSRFDEVVREMAEQKFGSAVVTHNGAVIGIVTTVDVCRALADTLSKGVSTHEQKPLRKRRSPQARGSRASTKKRRASSRPGSLSG